MIQTRRSIRIRSVSFGHWHLFRASCFGFGTFSIVVLAAFAGCDNTDKGTVSGTVTFDGQPVPTGAVTFVKEDGELVREGAVIQDGKFQASLPPGKYKIELNAQKVVGKRTQVGMDGKSEEVVTTEELFPARFNTQTELREEIERGAQTIKLDLKE
jgi:hypothetical protein